MAKRSTSRRRGKARTDSLAAELSAIRAEYAETFKRFAPDWSGQCYMTWREYPHVPDIPEANDARSAVQICDSLLWLLQATRSAAVYKLSQRQLEDFAGCYATLQGIRELRSTRPLISAGVERLIVHPKRMRDARSKAAVTLRPEKRQRAEDALKAADGDSQAAAKRIGKSVRTFNRWLHGQ